MAPVRALRWLTRLLLTGGLCLAAAAFWLYYAGLPRWMLRQVVTELAQRGLHLEAEALHWDPLGGLTLSQARYYLNTNPETPMLTAQRMMVTTRLWRPRRARMDPREVFVRLRVHRGRSRSGVQPTGQ